MSKQARWISILVAAGAAVAAAGCGGNGNECEARLLDPELMWYGENRARLDDFMAQHGTCPGDENMPVAVVGFDHTSITGNLGDAMFFDLLMTDRVHQPNTWADTSKHLSAEALFSLTTHCPLDIWPDPLPTSTSDDCLTAMICLYLEGAVWNGMQLSGSPADLCTGAAAWDVAGEDAAGRVSPAQAWALSLHEGYTPSMIGIAARDAFQRRVVEPEGMTWAVGYLDDVDASIRVNEQIRDLVSALKANGFDVWITSEHSQQAVAALASGVLGVAEDRVIGTELSLAPDAGTTLYGFEGCGGYPDNTQDIMNYRQGKRCYINKMIFGISDGEAQMGQPSLISFAAGSSDSDIFFVDDATDMRLVLNRNEPEIMCHAYANDDGSWLINPLFIDPLPRQEAGYDCQPYGPPDQADTAFCIGGTYSRGTCSEPLQ